MGGWSAETSLTQETRRESFCRTPIGDRQREVLEELKLWPNGLTAWELAERLGRDVYVVRPRLTELVDRGLVAVVGKRFHEATDRNVAVFAVSPERRQGELF